MPAPPPPPPASPPPPPGPLGDPSTPTSAIQGVFSNPLTHLGAWLGVLTMVSSLVLLGLLGTQAPPAEDSDATRSLDVQFVLSGKVIIGARDLGAPAELLVPQINALQPQRLEERLAVIIIESRVVGPEAAVLALERLEAEEVGESPEPTLLDEVSRLVFDLASSRRASPPSEEQCARLERALPFLGPYLIASATEDRAELDRLDGTAVRSLLVLIGFAGWYAGAFLCGLLALVVVVVKSCSGRLTHSLRPERGRGSVYLETFGLWMLVFFGLSVVLGQLAIVGSLLSFFGSLVVLAWPRVRGIGFHVVWADLGLRRANPLKELLLGVVVYTMAIPLLVVGLVLSLAIGGALKLLFDYESAPSHPVTEMLGGSALELLMVYLVACVAAPVVEEIAFRGILYRYLRDVTGRMGFIASFGASALFSSVVFAAIHPQGLVFIPVLSALAVAFCIGREWRGSLVSPMVAHALNNAVTITLGTMLLG